MIRQLCAALAILVAVAVGCLVAAPRSRTSEASAQLDALYSRFAEAYATLDSEKVAELYADDARYLIGQDRQGILRGRPDIVATFSHLFEWARTESATLGIEFAIDRRVVGESLSYDVGSYRLKIHKQGADEPEIATGKFATVFEFDSDHGWRFVVDSWSDAPNMTFDDLARRSQITQKQ